MFVIRSLFVIITRFLHISKSIPIRDILNKVTVALKLALLASHMATPLIENLRKTSGCDVMFAKH